MTINSDSCQDEIGRKLAVNASWPPGVPVTNSNKVTDAESAQQRRPGNRSPATEELTENLARLPGLVTGILASAGDGSIQGQSSLLGDTRFQTTQRQALAAQIAQVQGNHHLQRVITASFARAQRLAQRQSTTVGQVSASRGQAGRDAIQRQAEERTSAPATETAASSQPDDEQQVSDAISAALRQFRQMPIDVPVNDPREGGSSDRVQQLRVKVPYFLYHGERKQKAKAEIDKSPAVQAALKDVPIETSVGKGSPAATRRFVQDSVNRGLIRRGRGDGWPPTAADIRQWMKTYGIGIDCSGFVYWALWQVQASRGGEAAAEDWASQFQSGGRIRRGWGHLVLQGARQVEVPSELRPGDIAQYRTKKKIGHYRIVMNTRHAGEYFYFTLAESSPGGGGPGVRQFRVRSDAESFDVIEVPRRRPRSQWRLANSEDRNYDYWRRPETSPAVPAAGEQAETERGAQESEDVAGTQAPSGTPAESGTPSLALGSLPGPEQVYGTEGATSSGTPGGASEQQGESVPGLARAVQQNARWGSRLGWVSRLDEIVRYFQSLGYVPANQTPNEQVFAQAVGQYQNRYPRLTNDGILGPNTWRRLGADMTAGGGEGQQIGEVGTDEGTGTESGPEGTAVRITYGRRANSSVVTNYIEAVIKDILRAAGETSAIITSTTRTPADQARVMYNNLEAHGEVHQKNLYGRSGDRVIDVWKAEKAAGKSATEIKSAMEAKIRELGPATVSRHCGDPTHLVALDIGPNSLSNPSKVVKAARADSRISKVIPPPQDPGIHLEIPAK